MAFSDHKSYYTCTPGISEMKCVSLIILTS